jgi:hypothetical protein
MKDEEIRDAPNMNPFDSDAERIKYVVELRRDFIRTTPITDETITKLDAWLAAQPNLPLAVAVQIWTRSMWVSACDYEREKDPHIKHHHLLSLRAHWEEFRELPEKLQEVLQPHWLEWEDVLNTEREKWEHANGYAQ